MRYMENPCPHVLDEIMWDESRKYKCFSYWNDDTSFALDIGDGELKNDDGEDYFIHCEHNCDDGVWHYVFEIWFEDHVCSISDFSEEERDKYLTEAEMKELRTIICLQQKNAGG